MLFRTVKARRIDKMARRIDPELAQQRRKQHLQQVIEQHQHDNDVREWLHMHELDDEDGWPYDDGDVNRSVVDEQAETDEILFIGDLRRLDNHVQHFF